MQNNSEEPSFFGKLGFFVRFLLEPVLKVKQSSLGSCSHVAPLGLKFVWPVFYKHVAPLGLRICFKRTSNGHFLPF